MYKVGFKERGETKVARRFSVLHAVNNSSRTETARHHAGERKVCQVSGYEWDCNAEAESIKDIDNMISPPTRCTRSNG